MSRKPSAPPSCKIMGYEISADPDGIRIEVTDYQAGIAFIPWDEVKSLKERSRHGHARLKETIVSLESEPEPLTAEASPASVAAAPPQPTTAPTPPPLTPLEEEIWGQGEGRGDFARDA